MYKYFNGFSRLIAYLGGLVLVALILVTCVSVTGRALNGLLHGDLLQNIAPAFAQWAIDLGVGPVNGDFEIIEAGVAFSIFAFLPLCQITNSHASVEIFTNALSPKSDRVLQLVIDTVFALVLVLIAIQLYNGMLSKMNSGQTTLLLEFPVWWGYAICMLGAVVAAIVSVYVAFVRIAELYSGQQILPSAQGQ